MASGAGSLVDIHSHLVPGVDDGARDVPAVLDSVARFTRRGVHRILTTPHIRGSLTLDPNALHARLDEVSEAFETARVALAAAFPHVEYLRGHEVLIDVPDADFSDPRIRMAGTRFVLIEWPRLQVPPGTERVIRGILDQGYQPVIAHPERYSGMSESPSIAARWKEYGALLQVNYGSLVGRYGRAARVVSLLLLERGLVDYLASDFHGPAGMKIYLEEAWAMFAQRGSVFAAEVLAGANPARLIADLDPLPVPPLPPDTKLMGRLMRMLRGVDG